jgi:glycosyltransferase involved in cell wall biosynthesis
MREPYRIGIPVLDVNINHSINEEKISLVHAHTPFSAGILAMRAARKRAVPIVGTFHSKYRDDFGRVVHNKIILDQIIKNIVNFYESVDEVWIPQRHVEETLREYGFKGKVEVVENGIDVDLNSNARQLRLTSRNILGISEDRDVFLYVGQLILEKNLKFILESLRYLENKNFILFFVGQGYARPVLEKLVEEYHLSENVRFIGPVYDREELRRFYALADLFLFPSLYDNAPLVVREAASMKTPALLLRGATAAEVIKDNYNGFLAENDPYLFSRRIKTILSEKKLLQNNGENASQTLCRSWQDVVEEVKDRYFRLMLRKMN